MPRKRKSVEQAVEAKAKTVKVLKGRQGLGAMAFEGKRKKAPKTRSIGKVQADRLMLRIDERVADGDFTDMKSDEWVALFCWMHDAIYGVSAVDETRTDWKIAGYWVSSLLTDEFGGDTEEFFRYMQYVAKDEEERENWRRSNKRTGKRLRWRDFFLLKRSLNDYRLYKARLEGPA